MGGLVDVEELTDSSSDVLGKALGTGSPTEQVVYNLIIAAFAYGSSGVGLFMMVFVGFLATFLIGVGVLRFWTPFDNLWPFSP